MVTEHLKATKSRFDRLNMYNSITSIRLKEAYMRDTNWLDLFYEKLKLVHNESFPDYRFGQLMINFFTWLSKKEIDPFYIEESEMIKLFVEFADWYNIG